MAEIRYFTKAGLEKLKAELHDLITRARPEMSRTIAEARDKGDLSENAEYDAAKEAQGYLEDRILKLESDLANAREIDESIMDTSKALVLSTVRVMNHKFKKEFVYTLVSPNEADLKAGKISIDSPIGVGLLGKEVGDMAEVHVPSGIMKLEILEITRQ